MVTHCKIFVKLKIRYYNSNGELQMKGFQYEGKAHGNLYNVKDWVVVDEKRFCQNIKCFYQSDLPCGCLVCQKIKDLMNTICKDYVKCKNKTIYGDKLNKKLWNYVRIRQTWELESAVGFSGLLDNIDIPLQHEVSNN